MAAVISTSRSICDTLRSRQSDRPQVRSQVSTIAKYGEYSSREKSHGYQKSEHL